MKYLMLLVMVVTIPSSATRWECARWSWTGDVYNRKVVCLEWRDRDAVKADKKR